MQWLRKSAELLAMRRVENWATLREKKKKFSPAQRQFDYNNFCTVNVLTDLINFSKVDVDIFKHFRLRGPFLIFSVWIKARRPKT